MKIFMINSDFFNFDKFVYIHINEDGLYAETTEGREFLLILRHEIEEDFKEELKYFSVNDILTYLIKNLAYFFKTHDFIEYDILKNKLKEILAKEYHNISSSIKQSLTDLRRIHDIELEVAYGSTGKYYLSEKVSKIIINEFEDVESLLKALSTLQFVLDEYFLEEWW